MASSDAIAVPVYLLPRSLGLETLYSWLGHWIVAVGSLGWCGCWSGSSGLCTGSYSVSAGTRRTCLSQSTSSGDNMFSVGISGRTDIFSVIGTQADTAMGFS